MPEPEELLQDEKITINGQEYDPNEAAELLEVGRKTRDAESKFNVTFDSIMPAYTKANERAKLADQYEKELSEAKQQLAEYTVKKESGTDTPADVTEAKEAARKLGLTFSEDLDKNYIKRDELEKYFDERDKRNQAIAAVNKEADDLSTEFSGEDGRPKFNKKVVLAYAQAYGKATLREAYDEMHADVLSDWQKRQVDAQKKPGLKTLTTQPGNKKPEPVKPNDKNSKDLLMEALWGTSE